MIDSSQILVTGASGFVGLNVRKRWSDIKALPRGIDLTQPDPLREVLPKLLTDGVKAVIHLAAQSNPQESYSRAIKTWEVNLLGTVRLLEALSELGWDGCFLQVSTGAVYESGSGQIDETSRTSPDSPYVASKLAAEMAALEWGQRTGNKVVVCRPFNHSGPGQTDRYFLPSMTSQICSLPVEGGVIEVGNLAVQRDFLHVADVISAYALLLDRGEDGEVYNVAMGRSVELQYLVDELIALSGKEVELKVSPERFRPGKAESLSVDLSKIQAATGWQPEMSLPDLCRDLLDDWKERQRHKEL